MMTPATSQDHAEHHCPRSVSGSDGFIYYRCNRPAPHRTEEGEWLCGRHMAGYRRSMRVRAAAKEVTKASQDSQANAERLSERLAEFGISARLHYVGLKEGYSGQVIVDPAEVLRALEQAND